MEDVALPRWAQTVAATVAALATAAGTAAGAYYLFRGRARENTRAESKLADERAAAEGERAAAVKREALAEAWATVDKQNVRLEQQEDELREARDRLARCEADRAVLRLVVAWAKRKGMPMTPELDELLRERSAHPPREPHEEAP